MEDIGRLFSKILPEDSTFHNQMSFYKYAVETKDLVLEENCVQYMAWNYQNLTRSPAWSSLSVGLLRALLTRSDLVAPGEYFVLQSVERWISEKGDSIDLETQADLLGRIRFPMIPAEKLYVIESSSPLYSTHKTVYRDNMLKAFQFNVLLFSNLTKQKFGKDNINYQPRIYTAEPWSIVLEVSSSETQSGQYNNRYNNYGYGYNPYSQTRSKSFTTPVHNSLIFKDTVMSWQANIFINRQECSNYGVSCESFPVLRLTPQSYISQSEILFRNRVLLVCQGKYVCQVQDFKSNMASVSANATQVLPYPCAGDQFTYQIVVTPEYVWCSVRSIIFVSLLFHGVKSIGFIIIHASPNCFDYWYFWHIWNISSSHIRIIASFIKKVKRGFCENFMSHLLLNDLFLIKRKSWWLCFLII